MTNFNLSNVETSENIKRIRCVDPSNLAIKMLPWQRQGLSQTASGYGRKLTSRYMINFEGKAYRVYYTCFSNVASFWFLYKGEKIFLSL